MLGLPQSGEEPGLRQVRIHVVVGAHGSTMGDGFPRTFRSGA